MRQIAEQIVGSLIEGRFTDWLSDKWNDIKVTTGIGHDEFGMGKPDKGFKPKYGPVGTGYTQKKRPPLRPPPEQPGEKTWRIPP